MESFGEPVYTCAVTNSAHPFIRARRFSTGPSGRTTAPPRFPLVRQRRLGDGVRDARGSREYPMEPDSLGVPQMTSERYRASDISNKGLLEIASQRQIVVAQDEDPLPQGNRGGNRGAGRPGPHRRTRAGDVAQADDRVRGANAGVPSLEDRVLPWPQVRELPAGGLEAPASRRCRSRPTSRPPAVSIRTGSACTSRASSHSAAGTPASCGGSGERCRRSSHSAAMVSASTWVIQLSRSVGAS